MFARRGRPGKLLLQLLLFAVFLHMLHIYLMSFIVTSYSHAGKSFFMSRFKNNKVTVLSMINQSTIMVSSGFSFSDSEESDGMQ